MDIIFEIFEKIFDPRPRGPRLGASPKPLNLKVLKVLKALRSFNKSHNFAAAADREPERFGSFFFCEMVTIIVNLNYFTSEIVQFEKNGTLIRGRSFKKL